jgi:hypothetical protein
MGRDDGEVPIAPGCCDPRGHCVLSPHLLSTDRASAPGLFTLARKKDTPRSGCLSSSLLPPPEARWSPPQTYLRSSSLVNPPYLRVLAHNYSHAKFKNSYRSTTAYSYVQAPLNSQALLLMSRKAKGNGRHDDSTAESHVNTSPITASSSDTGAMLENYELAHWHYHACSYVKGMSQLAFVSLSRLECGLTSIPRR